MRHTYSQNKGYTICTMYLYIHINTPLSYIYISKKSAKKGVASKIFEEGGIFPAGQNICIPLHQSSVWVTEHTDFSYKCILLKWIDRDPRGEMVGYRDAPKLKSKAAIYILCKVPSPEDTCKKVVCQSTGDLKNMTFLKGEQITPYKHCFVMKLAGLIASTEAKNNKITALPTTRTPIFKCSNSKEQKR